MNTKNYPLTRGPKEGKNVSVVGATYRILVSGDDTNGDFATIDMLVPPGGGPGPHAHAGFAETFYVIAGEVEVKSEAGSYVAEKGAFTHIPKGGIVHGFKNKTGKWLTCFVQSFPLAWKNFSRSLANRLPMGNSCPTNRWIKTTSKSYRK